MKTPLLKSQELRTADDVGAKEAYVDSYYAGRFMTSIKTHLRDLSLRSTRISGKFITLEEIISELLKIIRISVEEQFGEINHVYVGRPVHLGDSAEDDQSIEARINRAYELAGFQTPTFVLEPVAAALAYKRRIKSQQLALIADFGGGTLDYSIVRVQPVGNKIPDEVLGVSGARIGGEDLTAAAMRLFWSDFGYGSEVLDFTRTKYHPIPHHYFWELSQWTNLWRFQSFREEIFRLIGWGSTDPNGLERLAKLLEDDCYFDFLSHVEALKLALTDNETVQFEYDNGPIRIRRQIARSDFEERATRYMERAKQVLQDVLDKSRVNPEEVEAIFLTGGSSQVPAFKKMIASIFDSSLIQTGNAFTSVAEGLAAYGNGP